MGPLVYFEGHGAPLGSEYEVHRTDHEAELSIESEAALDDLARHIVNCIGRLAERVMAAKVDRRLGMDLRVDLGCEHALADHGHTQLEPLGDELLKQT